jgi:alkylmercury lyase
MGSLQSTVEQLLELLPNLNVEERQISKFLYQKLSLGRPVSIESIADEFHKSIQEIQVLLKQMAYVEYSATGEISAYRGVTLNQTRHYLFHNNFKIYTWCAFDTLFLADLLVEPVSIASNCPTCGKRIAFDVNDRNITSSKESDTVMSFIIPDKVDYCENLQNAFCCKVHFFCNQQCGSEWVNLSHEISFFDLAESLVIAQERNRQFLRND